EQIVVIQGTVDAKGTGQPKILVNTLTREFKLTRPSQAPGGNGTARPREAAVPAQSTDEPISRPARRVSEAPPAWDDAGGPPPWLDDDLPLPADDFSPAESQRSPGTASPVKTAGIAPVQAPPVVAAPANGSQEPVLEAVGAPAAPVQPANGDGASRQTARPAVRPTSQPAARPAVPARA